MEELRFLRIGWRVLNLNQIRQVRIVNNTDAPQVNIDLGSSVEEWDCILQEREAEQFMHWLEDRTYNLV